MESSISRVGSIAARTVHVKMHPTPRTFTERREVLRVLERFGEVTMFRSLKYHPLTPIPNAFLLIFQSEEVAKNIINTSPIRFRIVPEPPRSSETSGETLRHLESTPLSNEIESKSDAPDEEKLFELRISRSNFDHERHISSQPLYGPFKPVHQRYSYIASHLNRVIPKSLWSRGLSDWETDAVRWRKPAVSVKDEVEEEAKAGGGDPFVALRAAERLRKRKMDQMPKVMDGLKALMEERLLGEKLNEESVKITEEVLSGEKLHSERQQERIQGQVGIV